MEENNIIFEVVVGTYEEFVLGYQFIVNENKKSRELLQTFATHSHRASVRTVACQGKLVVSGGADETINIYNMITRKECGMLMEHNGTITSLSFTPDCSHLITTSEDGSIQIFRQGSWQMEKLWPNAHKGTAVTSLAVHPSGKMALSVGKDHTLRTWNLVKGRPAYTTNLYSRCRQLEHVVWSPGGTMFAIPMDMKLEITSTEKAGVLHTLEVSSKVTACTFLTDKVVCVGEASGAVTGFDTATGEQLWSLSGEERVRGVAYLHDHLVTATSSGSIRVYAAADPTALPCLQASADTGCRITCLTLFDYRSLVNVKKESVADDEDSTIKEDVTICTETKKKKPSGEKSNNTDPKRKKKNQQKTSFEKLSPKNKMDCETRKRKEENTNWNSKKHKIIEEMKLTKRNRKKKQNISNKEMKLVKLKSKSQTWIVEDSKR